MRPTSPCAASVGTTKIASRNAKRRTAMLARNQNQAAARKIEERDTVAIILPRILFPGQFQSSCPLERKTKYRDLSTAALRAFGRDDVFLCFGSCRNHKALRA